MPRELQPTLGTALLCQMSKPISTSTTYGRGHPRWLIFRHFERHTNDTLSIRPLAIDMIFLSENASLLE